MGTNNDGELSPHYEHFSAECPTDDPAHLGRTVCVTRAHGMISHSIPTQRRSFSASRKTVPIGSPLGYNNEKRAGLSQPARLNQAPPEGVEPPTS